MLYRQLGKTDLKVSTICFGCWQLSPSFWGEVSLDPWKEAVQKSLDQGVNFIDTANAYGNGYAEECLGDLLKKENLRKDFVIATKFYWNFESGDTRYPDTSYDHILQACENSLQRLKIDCIDLYQIHSFDPLTNPEETAAALNRLKKEGKIRWIGVSNLNSAQIQMYQKYMDVECLQPCYNLLRRDPEKNELPLCLQEKIGVMAYSPLHSGLLSGKYKKDQVFEDFRKDSPLYQGKKFEQILDALESLESLRDKYHLTTPQLAIRWILTHPAITSAIVGIKTLDHIESIAKAGDDVLERPDWFEMAGVLENALK